MDPLVDLEVSSSSTNTLINIKLTRSYYETILAQNLLKDTTLAEVINQRLIPTGNEVVMLHSLIDSKMFIPSTDQEFFHQIKEVNTLHTIYK